jgi:hypothetical protein
MTDHEDGLILRPSGRKFASKVVGGVKLVVGREDGAGGLQGEVKTGGWVIVRFTPRATGLKSVVLFVRIFTMHSADIEVIS